MNLAPALLLYVGMLTGLNAPLGKLAAEAGVAPQLWAVVVSGGAAVPLAIWLALRGRIAWPGRDVLRYSVLAGLITFVGANFVLFLALPRVGAGYMGLMFALSPLFTLALSLAAGLRRPGAAGLYGLTLGCAGAVMIAVAKGAEVAEPLWAVIGLAMPALLAVGNVYRTIDWPEGADPIALAVGSHAVAAVVFVTAVVMLGTPVVAPLAEAGPVTLAQIAASAITFPAFFLLQRLGGPVLLSQLGYVAAATGLFVAVVFLGESFGALAWAGTLVIAAGIALTILDQRGAASSSVALGRMGSG